MCRNDLNSEANIISINLAFIAANGLGIWEWNRQTQKSALGKSIFAFDGMHNKNFSDAVITWKKYLHPDDRECGDREIQVRLRDGKPFEIDFRVCQPGNKHFHIKSMVKAFYNNGGDLIRIQGANLDITEFKLS